MLDSSEDTVKCMAASFDETEAGYRILLQGKRQARIHGLSLADTHSKNARAVNNHKSVKYVVYMAEPMTATPRNVK